MKTKQKGKFLGVNNRRQPFDLHVDKQGDFLRAGVNIDIDGSGNIRRRAADSLIQAMTAPHSLYTAKNGTRYLVRAGMLYVVTLPTYSETLFKVLSSNAPMSYVEFNGSLYCSNGTDAGRIFGGSWFPLGLPLPDEPTATTIGGTLFAGSYQISVSYTNSATGEEGGVGPSNVHALTTPGGLRIALPPSVPGATHVNVYVSTVNGSVPFLQTTVAVGSGSVDIASLVDGREANQRYEVPLPPGTLFMFNSMLCSYSGSDVFEGLPAKPGYYVPLTDRELEGGRIPFPAEVSNVVPAQNGVYVVADKTYWFPGTRMTKAEMVADVLPYGGVKGTAFESPNKSVYGWFGEKGLVLGTPSGEVQAVMSDNIDLMPPDSGVSAVFETRGYRQVVSCGWCVNLDNLAATQYADYDFTSISGQYGTKADGIYDLAATGEVAYVVDFGQESFGSEQKKTMPAAYLGASSSGPLQLRIQTPDADYTYAARSFSNELEMHRVDPGKGLRSNWFSLSLVGESDFTLASASFAPVASSRRI